MTDRNISTDQQVDPQIAEARASLSMWANGRWKAQYAADQLAKIASSLLRRLTEPAAECVYSPMEKGDDENLTTDCGHEWHLPHGLELYAFCPFCGKPSAMESPARDR